MNSATRDIPTRTKRNNIVSISVSYPHQRNFNVHYEAETTAGWYIDEYKIHTTVDYGRNSWTVSKTAANSDFITEEKVKTIFKELIEYARNNGDDQKVEERLNVMRESLLDSYRRTQASHSRIEIQGQVSHDGNELDRKGGSLKLDLEVTEFRFFAPEEIDEVVERAKSIISGSQPLDLLTQESLFSVTSKDLDTAPSSTAPSGGFRPIRGGVDSNGNYTHLP